MNSNKPIFLKGDKTVVNLDGLELTIGELKNHVMDSTAYRNYLKELSSK